ncbi:MAG: hypothetical protein JW891_08410 [Candidatus Lokiarchaeota archaeon]|nr:hypothetical protein [Candidatus Lokiarchaeota archaeon]
MVGSNPSSCIPFVPSPPHPSFVVWPSLRFETEKFLSFASLFPIIVQATFFPFVVFCPQEGAPKPARHTGPARTAAERTTEGTNENEGDCFRLSSFKFYNLNNIYLKFQDQASRSVHINESA